MGRKGRDGDRGECDEGKQRWSSVRVRRKEKKQRDERQALERREIGMKGEGEDGEQRRKRERGK